MNEFQKNILIIVIVVLVLILIFREVQCWYWKINKRIELQEKQIEILEEILQIVKPEQSVELIVADDEKQSEEDFLMSTLANNSSK